MTNNVRLLLNKEVNTNFVSWVSSKKVKKKFKVKELCNAANNLEEYWKLLDVKSKNNTICEY